MSFKAGDKVKVKQAIVRVETTVDQTESVLGIPYRFWNNYAEAGETGTFLEIHKSWGGKQKPQKLHGKVIMDGSGKCKTFRLTSLENMTYIENNSKKKGN